MEISIFFVNTWDTWENFVSIFCFNFSLNFHHDPWWKYSILTDIFRNGLNNKPNYLAILQTWPFFGNGEWVSSRDPFKRRIGDRPPTRRFFCWLFLRSAPGRKQPTRTWKSIWHMPWPVFVMRTGFLWRKMAGHVTLLSKKWALQQGSLSSGSEITIHAKDSAAENGPTSRGLESSWEFIWARKWWTLLWCRVRYHPPQQKNPLEKHGRVKINQANLAGMYERKDREIGVFFLRSLDVPGS